MCVCGVYVFVCRSLCVYVFVVRLFVVVVVYFMEIVLVGLCST